MKEDLEFLEEDTSAQLKEFKDFQNKTKRRSLTILEIGAGPVQPLARTMARERFLKEKYKVTLISINPLKEREGAYYYE